MGKLVNLPSYIGISSKEKVFALNRRNFEVTVVEIPPPKVKLKTKEHSKGIDGDQIVCLASSKNGQYMAVATYTKRLLLWNVPSWSLIKEESLIKRPMAIVFHPDSSKIIVADKNGEVYDFPVMEEKIQKKPDPYPMSYSDDEPESEALLGHLSMLLDLAISEDGNFLITCDRDEKIRVSCYPNCYNIHTFCMGHEEFVSQVKVVPNRRDRLLSASGDGKVKLWNQLEGECLATLDVRLKVEDTIGHRLREAAKDANFDLKSTFTTNLQILFREDGECILGISLYKLPLLLFYEVKSTSLRFMFSQNTAAPLQDFLFLEDSRQVLVLLETLEEGLENPLIIYNFIDNFTGMREIKDHSLLKFGQEYKEQLKAKCVWSLDADSLYKHRYDNVADYQKKKQERLSGVQAALPQKRRISE